MQFRGMIKLRFFKSIQNKITKKCQLYFSLILNLKKKKRDNMARKQFKSEKKKKEDRNRRKKEKDNIKKID